MASKYFDQIKVSESSKRYIDKSFAISDRIITILEQKQMTQRQLAEKMGKRESEISKWLTGTHNFTLKTIAKLEEVLGDDIFLVITSDIPLHLIGETDSKRYYKNEKHRSNWKVWQNIELDEKDSTEMLYAVSA